MLKKQTNSFLKKFYAFYVIIAIPFLCLYIIPETDITYTIITFAALLVLLLITAIREHKIIVDKIYLPFILYLVIHTILTPMFFPDVKVSRLILVAGQYAGYLFLLCFFNRRYFDRQIFTRYILVASDIASGYILFQQLLSAFFGVMLGAGIPFLPLKNEGIRTYVEGVRYWNQTYRPRSLFSEPALYATFTVLALAVVLTIESCKTIKEAKKRNIRIALYLVGIAISKSLLGIFAAAMLCLLYFVKKRGLKRNGWRWIAALLMISPLILQVALENSSVQYLINRLTKTDFFETEARFSTFLNIQVLDLTSWNKVLLGHDFLLSNFPGEMYLPSFVRQLYCFGILGMIILIVLVWKLYSRSSKEQRLILITFFILMIGSELVHGGLILTYCAWLGDERMRPEKMKTEPINEIGTNKKKRLTL